MKDLIAKHTKYFFSGEPVVDTEAIMSEINEMDEYDLQELFSSTWSELKKIDKIEDILND